MAKPGTLRVDHHVLSAEGTRYIVRYVAVRQHDGEAAQEEADLAELGDNGDWSLSDRITLPTSELRRVAAQQLPAITGLPTERPRCPMCDKRLQPRTDYTYEGIHRRKVLARTFIGWRGYQITSGSDTERFCTTRCAMTFARAAYRAGYRITRSPRKDTTT